MDNDHQISKYDRLYGEMHDVCLRTKTSTIRSSQHYGARIGLAICPLYYSPA